MNSFLSTKTSYLISNNYHKLSVKNEPIVSSETSDVITNEVTEEIIVEEIIVESKEKLFSSLNES